MTKAKTIRKQLFRLLRLLTKPLEWFRKLVSPRKQPFGLFTKPVEWFRRFISPWSNAIILIGFASLEFIIAPRYPFLIEWMFGALILIIVCQTIISFVAQFNQDDLTSLRKQNYEKQKKINALSNNIEILFNGLAKEIARKADIYSDTKSRVSLYIHNEEGSYFVPSGRYSHNQRYEKKGRDKYPDDQGCIAKGWEEDWLYDDGLPKSQPAHENQIPQKYGIPKEVVSDFNMYSRVMAVKRLSHNGKNIAVVVVESTEKDKFEQCQLKRKLQEIERSYASTIYALYDHIIQSEEEPDNE